MNDDRPSPPRSIPLSTLVEARLSRRATLKGLLAGIGSVTLSGSGLAQAAADAPASSLRFTRASRTIAAYQQVSPGHRAQVLIRWGDPVLADAPYFDPLAQSAEAQSRQFGYNNDFIAFMPLPRGSRSSTHGLLCVNHEYTNPELMFPGVDRKSAARTLDPARMAVEMAAHGHSVVEIRKDREGWRVVAGSRHNRRITTLGTPMLLSGPAAGHERLRTRGDPSGRHILGTLNNCAGGVTPWGTVLIAEENFDIYFDGEPEGKPESANYRRIGIKGKSRYGWARFEPRFDIDREPNEPNRFGWVVEIDPYDPASIPVKRSALGRFKHEAATCVLAPDGRVVVYSGDDQAFEYLYRFVSARSFAPRKGSANRDLLDHGVLSVARFDDAGSLRWLPLVFGEGPLTPANGFHSQADVLIETRRAADLLGATPLDRPEDVETNPVNGRVYVMLTNNNTRHSGQIDRVNPRASNPHGHILELLPPGSEGSDGALIAQHAAEHFRWEVLLLAGDPGVAAHGARYHPETGTEGDWLSAPDNCCFDRRGRLWITTDQGSAQRRNGIPDGVYACDVNGAGRALTRFFYACPKDAEMCGPAFTPDNRTLFVAVQHPGEGPDSTFAQPSTRWPDFSRLMPPRPSVVAITREDGGIIGD